MRAETLFRAIGEVDEAMLQDAVTAAARPVKRPIFTVKNTPILGSKIVVN